MIATNPVTAAPSSGIMIVRVVNSSIDASSERVQRANSTNNKLAIVAPTAFMKIWIALDFFILLTTSSASTAGREARMQTGALLAVD